MRVLEQEKRFQRYILNDLPENERTEIEDSYMADGEFFDLVQIAEDELVDDYVRGRMASRDRSLFEKNYLCVQDHRQRVETARALLAIADARAAERPAVNATPWQRLQLALRFDSPGIRWALAAGFMLAVLGGPVMVLRINRLSAELDSVRGEQRALQQREQGLRDELALQKDKDESLSDDLTQEKRERGRLEEDIAKLREAQSPQPPVVFSLGSSNTGHFPGQPETLEVPRGAETVRLQMPLFEDTFQDYLITVKDTQGKEVLQRSLQSTKTTRGSVVSLRLPTRQLNAATYHLTLSGTHDKKTFEELTSYDLRIVKK